MWCWKRMETIIWNDCVRNEVLHSEGGEKCPTYNKKDAGQLDWSHAAQELPSEKLYCRKDMGKDRSDGEDEEEDVSSYWMALMKREDTVN